jgi:ABC-type lipoprotein release transport system permease subunit
MTNLTYKVILHDPLVFGLALIIMRLVALMACFLPAWRAMCIDPVRALRT